MILREVKMSSNNEHRSSKNCIHNHRWSACLSIVYVCSKKNTILLILNITSEFINYSSICNWNFEEFEIEIHSILCTYEILSIISVHNDNFCVLSDLQTRVYFYCELESLKRKVWQFRIIENNSQRSRLSTSAWSLFSILNEPFLLPFGFITIEMKIF